MERPHVRPRIALVVPATPAEVEQLLTRRLDAATPRLEGRVRRRAVLAWIGKTERRWWSPCLDLHVEPGAGGTHVTGWFCAHPRLMTANAFGAIGLTFLAGLSATWSLVQYTMKEPPQCLLGTAGAVAGLLALYGLHRLAQRWAAEQMHLLAALLEGLGEVRVDDAGAVST